MKILKEERSDLLNRTEYDLIEEYESNPGFEKVKKESSEFLKVEEDKISINKITSNFGRKQFIINLFVYDNLETKNKFHKIKEKKE